jgi:hypothetical protein
VIVKLRHVVPFVLLTACASPGPEGAESGLQLTVSPASPEAGETVTLTLNNQTAWPVSYNLCTSSLERDVAGEWQPVPEDRICTMELRLLAPDEAAETEIELLSPLEPGSYRYTVSVEDRGSMEPVSSEPFRIR